MAVCKFPLLQGHWRHQFKLNLVFAETPYAKVRWPSRLGHYDPSLKDIEELRHATMLEF